MDLLEFTGKVGIIVVVGSQLKVKINGHPHSLGLGDLFIVTPLFVYEDFEESADLRTERVSVELHSFLDQMKQHLRISFLLFIFNHPVNRMEDSDLQHCIRNFNLIGKQRRLAADAEIPEPLRNIPTPLCRTQLKNKSLSIKEIAQKLGFPEQFTFRKYFKYATGLSPTEFREMK